MTEATVRALTGLRDLNMIKWYVIPLLAIVCYIYVREIKDAKTSGNWEAVFAGLTIFGMDFINETWNSWVMVLSGRSAFWTAPGDTALRTMVGWNIEIMFMFSIMGIIYYHSLTEGKKVKILGIPEKWALAIGYSAFCVAVECLLNKGGHLVWEYSFWERSFEGVILIFLIGYFHFFCAAIFVMHLKTIRSKVITISCIYSVAVIMNIIGKGIMKWTY